MIKMNIEDDLEKVNVSLDDFLKFYDSMVKGKAVPNKEAFVKESYDPIVDYLKERKVINEAGEFKPSGQIGTYMHWRSLMELEKNPLYASERIIPKPRNFGRF